MNPWTNTHRVVQMPKEERGRWIDRDPSIMAPTRIQKPADRRQPVEGCMVALAVAVVLGAVGSVYGLIRFVQWVATWLAA